VSPSASAHFDNRITQLFGVEVPIANSPMGFVVKPDLVAAVANAGGIGLVPGSIGIAGAQEDIKRVRGHHAPDCRAIRRGRPPPRRAVPPRRWMTLG